MVVRTKKKIALCIVLAVFTIDTILSGTLFGRNKAFAAGTDFTNIISVFVDKNVMGSIGNEVERFTKKYVGRNYDNAKVMIFQIDTSGVSPADVVKINQNLYLEGAKTKASKLVGTVLIGDLPLPVVNKNGFIFPTVYPLVDFEKPKYYYDKQSDYFLYQGEGNSQPEVWHSVINFKGDGAKYKTFFDKLKKYAADPASWVKQGLWYDDIIHQKQTLNPDNIDKYINNTVFSEDVMYNRYTNLMVDIFQALHNTGVVETLGEYDDQVVETLEDSYYNDAEFQDIKEQYKGQLEKFWNLIKKLKALVGSNNNNNSGADPEPSDSALGTLPNSKFINTLFIQKVVDGFMKDYVELYGTSYFDTKEKRLQLAARYVAGQTGSVVDDHITVASKWDEVSKQMLADANTKLEKLLDDRIQQEGYAMNVLVPTRIEVPKNGGGFFGGALSFFAGGLFKQVKTYEVYYFGKPAEEIQNAEGFGIYRGTFNNIRSLGKLNNFDYTSWMDYEKNQSIGATRGENAREVEAHRGYDFSLIDYDQKQFDGYTDADGRQVVGVKDKMPYSVIKKKHGGKDISKYISWYWAGYTPLNIDPESDDIRLNIRKMDYTQLRNPFLDRTIGGSVFNIAGSRITTPDRKIGFTLGSEDEDNDDDSDPDVNSNTKSYSGYSDSFLGKDLFGSAIQVTRDDGKWLKFRTRLSGKYKYRNSGKPRIKNRSDIHLFSLGGGSLNDGLHLMPNGSSEYVTVVGDSDKHRNRYFKSIDSRFFHKSPTLEELYGTYVQLENFQTGAFGCMEGADIEDEAADSAQCFGYTIKFKDLFNGDFQTTLYAKRPEDYFATGGKVYFNSTAVRYEHGEIIDLSSVVGEITGTNNSKLYIRFQDRDIYLPWGETNFECGLRNVDDVQVGQCQGVKFKIKGSPYTIKDNYVDISQGGKLVTFYPGASINYMGKDYSLAGYQLVIGDNGQATFTGKQLQVGGMNEFTLERPVDSPRYVNFQGIGGDKLTWVYPNMRKVPVFKEENGKRVLKDATEIEIALKDYLRNKAKTYNDELLDQRGKRFEYYNGNEGGLPRREWINKFDNYDTSISPLVYDDNTGMNLRSYQLLPENFFIDNLATTREGKQVSSDDMVRIIAQQLYYQNVMRLQLPVQTSKKVLDEVSMIQSFADINHKSRELYSEYLVEQPKDKLDNLNSYDLYLPYYNLSGYEAGYINSDGADYVQFQTMPPLIKLIQKQKAKDNSTHKPKTVNDFEGSKCANLIPPSYVVPLSKWPAAFKCWLSETASSKLFDVKISFIGSANDVFGAGQDGEAGWLENTREEGTNQFKTSWKEYGQNWRSTIKTQDAGIAPNELRLLRDKLDNLIVTPSTVTPSLTAGVKLSLSAKEDLGSYTVQIGTTGANCLTSSNGSNLCQSPQTLQIKGLYSGSYDYAFTRLFDGVGDMNIQLKVCQSKCVYKNISVTVQPGEISKFKITHPMGQTLYPVARGVQLPMLIDAFDAYENRIGTTMYDFLVKTVHDGGLIYNNELTKQFQINSFVSAGFLLDTFSTQGNKETITIAPNPAFAALNPSLPKQEISFDIVDPVITLNATMTSFQLPESDTGLMKTVNGVSFVDTNKLPRVKATLNNGQKLYAVVNAKSLGGKFIPGVKGIKKMLKPDGQYVSVETFIPVEEVLSTGASVEFYLYPTMKAGDDAVQIQVGQLSKTITFTIKPASAKKTSLELDGDVMDLDGEIQGILSVTDIWGNMLPNPTNVLLGLYGNITIDGMNKSGGIVSVVGEKSFTLRPVYPGGQAYVFATLQGIPFDQQYPDYASVLVQNRARPIDNLNVAYMNLYGSDRSTQIDRKTNKVIGEAILTDSAKTLALTTQYGNPMQMYKTLFGIDTKGQIKQGATNAITLGLSNNKLGFYVEQYGFLPFVDIANINVQSINNLNGNFGGNSWFIKPGELTSTIQSVAVVGKQLLVNDMPVVDMQNGVRDSKIAITYSSNQGSYNVWNIHYGSDLVAQLIQTWSPNNDLLNERGALVDPTKYMVTNILVSQRHDKGIGILDKATTFSEEDKSTPSIQHSNDSKYNIGFGDTFKPLTNFAGGKSVGDSSIPFASEFVLNMGDPTYRIYETNQLVDHTNYDGGVGITAYTDPDKIIQQVVDVDRDKQGDRDLIVTYADGSVRLLIAKGNKEYVKVGDLMYIEDGISKLYVGDGDGDGYQDIFIHTAANQLRFYKNYAGERMDVDGYPICLDIPGGDKNLNEVWQWFLTDPNNDKVTDIIVNDKNNQIRLFIGGGGSTVFSLGFGGGNYISKDKYGCDDGWKQRQESKQTVVKSFAPKLDGTPLKDESLVHRNGLKASDAGTLNPNVDSEEDLEDPDKINVDIQLGNSKKPKDVINLVKNQLMSTFNPQTWINEYKKSLDTTVTLDATYRPVYETSALGEVVYKQTQSLLTTDKLDASKTYTDLNGGRLEDGDIVKIDIKLQNKGAGKATYIEKLSGPREIPVSGNQQVGFFAGNLNTDHVFVLQPGPSYVFMVDNIAMSSTVTFGYHVVYKSQQLVTMQHGEGFTDINGIGGSIGKSLVPKALAQSDENPAWLEIVPLDGCAKFKWKITVPNVGPILSNRFVEQKIDLEQQVADKQKADEAAYTQGTSDGFSDLVSDTQDAVSDELKGTYLRENWKQKGLLKDDPALKAIEQFAYTAEAVGNLSIQSNVSIGGFGDDIDNVLNKKIGELTRGLCEGFKVGQKNCSGIPILSSLPWNMAFLAPGDMQIMGCKIWKDKGIPLLWFPATLQTPIGPMPFLGPIGQKGPGDGFYWFGGGTYPSLVRMYFAPTLTAKLGIGICFGPYTLGIKLPKPFKDIMGNCIVFAVDPGIGKCKQTSDGSPSDYTSYVIDKQTKELDDTNTCNDDITVRNSPIKMAETAVNSADNWLDSAQGEYGLVIKLGGHANLTNYNSIALSDFVTKVRLEGGNPLDLELKGASDKGLVSCIMNQFADNQIRYIINNLTSMDINIVLPDLRGLGSQIGGVGSVFSKQARKEKESNEVFTDYAADYQNTTQNNTGSIKQLVLGKQSKQKLTKKLDTVLSNPFEKLALFFNDSELIRISSRDVLIEIPWIYTEDIVTIKGIYRARWRRNEPVIKERKDFAKDFVKQCESKTDQFEKQNCMQRADEIIQISNQLGQFEKSIRRNLQVLDEYGQFPSKVYQLLHGYDNYIYDLFNFAYGTIDAVTSRLSQLARGFDAWVDFIISLMSILKSRQILIDFSVNWKEKCSKCTVDNYSAYSCSFSKFCPKLPVFNIPPFKIPDITIDLSNIDLRTDIILPKFRFQPKRVGLFDNLKQFGLPDLPYPSQIGGLNNQINLKLPSIPVIPGPPDLDAISLPSFIPQIKFKGPTLPPAPRIPKIAPELGLAIDIADFIGRIFCLVKGGIGLVGEAGLKSRIEQMTQRTRQVEPFDSLKLLIPNAPLQTLNLFKPMKDSGGSLDYKLEAYADVKMYFDGVYGLFDGIARGINTQTRKILVNSDKLPGLQNVDEFIKKGNAGLTDILDTADDLPNVNVNINPFGYVETSDYQSINSKIKAELAYFTEKDNQPFAHARKLLAADVVRSYDLDTDVRVNTKGLEKVKETVNGVLQKELDNNEATKNWIKQDRDGWIDHLAATQYVSDDNVVYSVKTNLLDLDKETIDYLGSYDLAKEYVGTNKTVVDGYVNGLKNADYETLGMQKSDYDRSTEYLNNLKTNVDLARDHVNADTVQLAQVDDGVTDGEVQQTNCKLCDKQVEPLLLSQGGSSNNNSNNASFALGGTDDPTRYLNGYFVKGDDDNYHNVITNLDKGEQLSKSAFEKDLNGDKLHDIILWDDHNVYIKYAEKKPTKADQGSSDADTTTLVIDNVDDIQAQVDSYGYYGSWGDKIKIWSDERMPRQWQAAGQAYQSMTYTVTNEMQDGLAGYAVRYADSITKTLTKDADYKYILILDASLKGESVSDIDVDGVHLQLDDVQVMYVDPSQTTISAVLSNLPRRRYYSQVTKLSSQEQGGKLFGIIPRKTKDTVLRIYKSSPWSSTETAGMQIIADTSAPYADAKLIRTKKPTIVAQGDSMYGNIKTYYALSGLWYDDSKVVKNRIYSGNTLVASGDHDQILIPSIYSDTPVTLTYQLVGEDAAGNIGQKTVEIELGLPKISLDDVQTNTLGQSDILSSLDVDVDKGAVQFVRIRNGVTSVLESLFGKQKLFDTTTDQTVVTGGKFGFKQDIGFYDPNGKYLNVSLTPAGQIVNSNPAIKVTVDFNDNVPKIVLSQNNQELYRIYLKPKTFNQKKDVTVLNGGYETFNLPAKTPALGQFAGGICIKPKSGVCEIMISPSGYISIPNPHHRSYKGYYRFESGRVVYGIQKGKDTVAEIRLEVEAVKQ